MEAFYTIHKNDYQHDKSHYSLTGKCILANYIKLSVTLYFLGIGMSNKIDGKYAASNWKEATLSCFGITEHCI